MGKKARRNNKKKQRKKALKNCAKHALDRTETFRFTGEYYWSIGKQRIVKYTDEETSKYIADYEESLKTLQENVVVKGKVTSFSAGDVVLDINHKSDGLVSSSEFRDIPDLAVGDIVEVYVELTEDDRGQLVLSRRKAKLLKAWENIVDSYQNGTIIKGTIISKPHYK